MVVPSATVDPQAPPRRPVWMPSRLLVNLFVVGAFLRLLALGYWSLWLDEGATWSWTVLPTWQDTLFAEANHPPVWWAVTRAWTSLFGDSEAALRAPAALLGVISLGMVWILCLRVLDPRWAPRRGGFPTADDGGSGRRVAVVATVLIALSAYFIEYAQEARMYTALLVETLGLSLLYLRWLDRNDRLSLVAYALLGGLALYTHYFALWPLLAHAAHALWVARRAKGTPGAVSPLPFLTAVAAAGLLFVPWFVYLVGSFRSIAHIAPEPFSYLLYAIWRMGAGPALAVPDRVRQLEGPLGGFHEEWLVVVVVALLFLVPLTLGFVALRKRPGLASFVLANVLVPIGLMLAIYPLFPLIHERYLLFLAPWIFVLAVLGALSVTRWLRPVLVGGLVVLMVGGAIAYHGSSDVLVGEGVGGEIDGRAVPARYVPDPAAPLYGLQHGHAYGREPWRHAHEFVRAHAGPDDLVVLHPWYVHLAWDYYATHGRDEDGAALAPLETLRLPAELLEPAALVADYGEILKGRRRVFLVLAHEETPDPADYYRSLYSALGRLWIGEGAGIDPVPPIDFQLSWGVRVAVFTRTGS